MLNAQKNRFYKRLFEIIPGLLTWSTLITLIILAIIKPVWTAIFVITFDLYWVIRISYLTSLLLFAHRRLEMAKKVDWLKKCDSAGDRDGLGYKNIYHAVLFPAYREGLDILTASISALENSNYPKDRIIVVLSVEERAGREAQDNALMLKEKYKDKFFKFIATSHPDNIPGEARVKGANATWGAKVLKGFLDAEKIDYEHVILSCFDADTCVEQEYFSCLAYHYIKNPKRLRSDPRPSTIDPAWYVVSSIVTLKQSPSFSTFLTSPSITFAPTCSACFFILLISS